MMMKTDPYISISIPIPISISIPLGISISIPLRKSYYVEIRRESPLSIVSLMDETSLIITVHDFYKTFHPVQ